jgi:hypothetical protein
MKMHFFNKTQLLKMSLASILDECKENFTLCNLCENYKLFICSAETDTVFSLNFTSLTESRAAEYQAIAPKPENSRKLCRIP